jgi:hypothetical protein
MNLTEQDKAILKISLSRTMYLIRNEFQTSAFIAELYQNHGIDLLALTEDPMYAPFHLEEILSKLQERIN